VSAGLVTLVGLICDDQLNVVGNDGTTPIKGLYASGDCLGGRYGNSYCTPSAGNSMGMAKTHGRVAGKIVAAL
jgi:predicted oxidoreductase